MLLLGNSSLDRVWAVVTRERGDIREGAIGKVFDLSALLGSRLGHANAAARAGDYGLLLELVVEVAEDWRRFYSYMRVRTVADDDSESMLRARQLQERYTALGLGQ